MVNGKYTVTKTSARTDHFPSKLVAISPQTNVSRP